MESQKVTVTIQVPSQKITLKLNVPEMEVEELVNSVVAHCEEYESDGTKSAADKYLYEEYDYDDFIEDEDELEDEDDEEDLD